MGPDLIIQPAVRRAIAATQANGVWVTLATGRMFKAALPFARLLGVKAPLLCYQGGWIQAVDDPEPRYRIPLAPEIAATALRLGEAQHWHIALYADGEIFLRDLRYPRSLYEKMLGPDFHQDEDWDEVLAKYTPDKVLFVGEPDEIPAMGVLLRETLGRQADVMRSHARFIEVIPKGADKGSGLAWLARHLGVPRESVMAVGDHENDGSMVQWAGIGVAMGNAVPGLKGAADWVAPGLEADGAAAALERFVLMDSGVR